MNWAGQYAQDMQKSLRDSDPCQAKVYQQETLKTLADVDIEAFKTSPRHTALVRTIEGYEQASPDSATGARLGQV